jgi:hypothetical protein
LLRRPHNHRRELRARRPTARTAVTPSRGQSRRTMTPAATRAHRTPAGRLHSRRRTAFASAPPVGAPPPSIGRNSHNHHRLPSTKSSASSPMARPWRWPRHYPPRPPPHQIPIDVNRNPAARGFLLGRLSQRAPPTPTMGRHPKPFT